MIIEEDAVIKDLERQIEEAKLAELGTEFPEATDEPSGEEVEHEGTDEKLEQTEETPEAPKQHDSPSDPKDWVRMRKQAEEDRRIAADERRRAAELEARISDMEARAQSGKTEEEKRDSLFNNAITEIIDSHLKSKADREFEQLKSRAADEFLQIERDFREQASDYDDVSNKYGAALYNSIRIQNPTLSHQEVSGLASDLLFKKVAVFASRGMNPAEQLYNEAKAIISSTAQQQEVPKEKEKKLSPDMTKVAANKARSSNMAGTSSGTSGSVLTKKLVEEMTNAEYRKAYIEYPEEMKRIEREL